MTRGWAYIISAYEALLPSQANSGSPDGLDIDRQWLDNAVGMLQLIPVLRGVPFLDTYTPEPSLSMYGLVLSMPNAGGAYIRIWCEQPSDRYLITTYGQHGHRSIRMIAALDQVVGAIQMLLSNGSSTGVPGLSYIDEYLTAEEQGVLIRTIDQQPWLTNMKRRVQHYGYRYDYKARAVHETAYLGDLPEWLMPLAVRLRDDGWIAEVPDQAIINEYEPGQGITRHVDCVPCFGDTILSISLNSACVMTFTRIVEPIEVQLLLPPRSLTIMRGESRYEWKHGIAARKTDTYLGEPILRGRRLSITFRKVIT